MSLSRRASLVGAGIAMLTSQGSAAAGSAQLAGGKLMFMVRRFYAKDIDIPALRTPAEPAHQQHLLKFGQTVVASAIIDDNGARVGSVSIRDSLNKSSTRSVLCDS